MFGVLLAIEYESESLVKPSVDASKITRINPSNLENKDPAKTKAESRALCDNAIMLFSQQACRLQEQQHD